MMSLSFGSEVRMCVFFSVVMNLCLCVSAHVSGEGPDVSSAPAGVQLPGPAEVHLSSADRRV